MTDLINGRTPEEIKSALEHCPVSDCRDCVYWEAMRDDRNCVPQIDKDALALIKHLEAKLAEKDERIEALREMME